MSFIATKGFHKYFTLLELIVVMAIISLLLTLLVPAISTVRDKAREKTCLSNLRSIGQVAMSYSLSSNDYAMPANFGDTTEGGYGHFSNYLISKYDFAPQGFMCPSMKVTDMFDPAGHDPAGENTFKTASYIMNIVQKGNWAGSPIPTPALSHGWGLDSTSAIPLGSVNSPSKKLMVMDVMSKISNNHSGVNYFRRSDHGSIANPPTGMFRWVGMHHFSKFNTTFGDGHGEVMYRTNPFDWAVNL